MSASPQPTQMKKMSIPAFAAHKASSGTGDPLVCMTAYTANDARFLGEAADLLLVGDSLGPVVLGLPDTRQVTLDHMCLFGRAVTGAQPPALVIVDMPFGSYHVSAEQAVTNGLRVMQETLCDGVKVEGGAEIAPHVAAMVRAGIPVMGHVGVTPQSIAAQGGYGARGKTKEQVIEIFDGADALVRAGAFSVVLEAVMAPIGPALSKRLPVPVIGIGGGVCDGQIIVSYDVWGFFDRTAKFVDVKGRAAQDFRAMGAAFAGDVRDGTYPGDAHMYRPTPEVTAMIAHVVESRPAFHL